jgi:hypothetical protein
MFINNAWKSNFNNISSGFVFSYIDADEQLNDWFSLYVSPLSVRVCMHVSDVCVTAYIIVLFFYCSSHFVFLFGITYMTTSFEDFYST